MVTFIRIIAETVQRKKNLYLDKLRYIWKLLMVFYTFNPNTETEQADLC